MGDDIVFQDVYSKMSRNEILDPGSSSVRNICPDLSIISLLVREICHFGARITLC
jgi:hypothetical protein